MSFLNELIIVEFILFLLTILITNFDFNSPGTCSITIFFFATLLLKLVENSWKIVLSGYCFFVITVGLAMIVVAEFVATKTTIKRSLIKNRKQDNAFITTVNTHIQKSLVCLSVILMAIYVVEIMSKGQGIGATGLSSIGAVANSMSNGTERLSIVGKIAFQYCTLIPYPFCWLFSKLSADKKNNNGKNWINLIPICSGIIVQFFCANRHNILRIIFAFTICYYHSIRKENRISRQKRRKIIIRMVLLFLGFCILFYIVRDIVKVSSHSIPFVEYFIYYLSSPIVLFSKYLDSPNSVRAASNLWGETCFTGLYSTLARWGLVDNVNVITNHTVIGGTSGIRTGNTYTFFMRPYHDFGLNGVIIFTLIVFMIACISYHKVVTKDSWSIKSYRNKMMTTIFFGYFYYVFPIAVTDFYITIESKIMNIAYLAIICIICNLMIKISYKKSISGEELR